MTKRCPWCGTDPLYVAYHDDEWGVPEYDPRKLWEMLMLEAFQAGLSWITILRKRENFREVFEGFDPQVLANWNNSHIENALQNPGIIRHRGKIEATVTAARLYLEIEADEGFSPFIWSFVGGKPVQNSLHGMADAQAKTPASEAMSKALKKKGFKFCGPVIAYAYMQAAGMVNDHLVSCPRHGEVKMLSPAG